MLQVRQRLAVDVGTGGSRSGAGAGAGGNKGKGKGGKKQQQNHKLALAAARQEQAGSLRAVTLSASTLPGLLALLVRGFPEYLDAASAAVRDA